MKFSEDTGMLTLSGDICTGKSSLALSLCESDPRMHYLSCAEVVRRHSSLRSGAGRSEMQAAGEELAVHGWTPLLETIARNSEQFAGEIILLDGLRHSSLLLALRRLFDDRLLTIGLECSSKCQVRRMAAKGDTRDSLKHPVEQQNRSLAASADILVDTTDRTPLRTLTTVRSSIKYRQWIDRWQSRERL